jgi:hypothetical protein
LQEAHIAGKSQAILLLLLAQPGQVFRVPLLQGDQESIAQGLDLAADLHRLPQQHGSTDGRYGLVDVIDDAGDVKTRRGGPHQGAGVDGRIEQGQLTHHALDVHTVTELEQPVGDLVPVTEQLVVLGTQK